MKIINLFFIYAFICAFDYAKAQINRSCNLNTQCDSLYNQVCSDDIFGHPQILPEFPGGFDALSAFLRNNIQYPEELKKDSIRGRVIVQFIIDELGNVTCPRIKKSVHSAADEEVFRVIKLMPNWKPASNNSFPCKICYTLPIWFQL
jgi:TonB family protein